MLSLAPEHVKAVMLQKEGVKAYNLAKHATVDFPSAKTALAFVIRVQSQGFELEASRASTGKTRLRANLSRSLSSTVVARACGVVWPILKTALEANNKWNNI